MRAVAILLIALVMNANAGLVQEHPLQYGGSRSIMNVMMQVESKLKSGSPLDTVNGILDGFKTAVNEEQAAHDDVYQRQQNECNSESAYRRTEVLDATNALRAANQQLKTCSISMNKAKATLAQTEEFLLQAAQHFDLINEVRREETAAFNKNAVSFNDALNAIDDSVDISAGIQSGASSFAQLAKSSSILVQHAVQLGKIQAYQPVLTAFAQVTQEGADQSAVERLVQMLQTLRSNLENAWQAYQEENNVSLQAFNEQKERVTGNLARLQKNEETLNNKIEVLSGCVATQTALSQAASNKQSRNQVLLDDATVLCSAFDREYVNTTAGRRAEATLVAELYRLVARRFEERQDE